MTLKWVYGPHAIYGLQKDMVYGPNFVVHLILMVWQIYTGCAARTLCFGRDPSLSAMPSSLLEITGVLFRKLN